MAKTSTAEIQSDVWVALPLSTNFSVQNVNEDGKDLNVFFVVDDTGSFTANSDFETASKLKLLPDETQAFAGLAATDQVWARLKPTVNSDLRVKLTILS